MNDQFPGRPMPPMIVEETAIEVGPTLEKLKARLARSANEPPPDPWFQLAGQLFSLLRRAWERVACELFPADPRPTLAKARGIQRTLEKLDDSMREIAEAKDVLGAARETIARLQPLVDAGIKESPEAVARHDALNRVLALAVRSLAVRRTAVPAGARTLVPTADPCKLEPTSGA